MVMRQIQFCLALGLFAMAILGYYAFICWVVVVYLIMCFFWGLR